MKKLIILLVALFFIGCIERKEPLHPDVYQTNTINTEETNG